MKILILFLAIIATFYSCEPTADNTVKIYKKGIKAAQEATSLQELHDISVNVKEQLLEEGAKFNGDKKMSAEETKKALDAQKEFYQAVEKASIRLGEKVHWVH